MVIVLSNMPPPIGKFIAFEGIDGSGKATQCERAAAQLKREGQAVEVISLPQYGKKSAGPVEEFIRGAYGDMHDVSPCAAALLFAVDHFDAGVTIRRMLNEGKTVIANRYVRSNFAYQGARIDNAEERVRLFRWLEEIEYTHLNLPQPDLTLLLRVPPEASAHLAKTRAQNDKKTQDRYETVLQFQKKVDMIYHELAASDPTWRVIECAPSGVLLSIAEIHAFIMRAIQHAITNP